MKKIIKLTPELSSIITHHLNKMLNIDPYVNAGDKLKTTEKQIEELNRDLIYWNTKMCASTCSTKIKEAHDMIKIIQSEFDRLNYNTLFNSNFKNDDSLIQQNINNKIEEQNIIVDDIITKGKHKALFMYAFRD